MSWPGVKWGWQACNFLGLTSSCQVCGMVYCEPVGRFLGFLHSSVIFVKAESVGDSMTPYISLGVWLRHLRDRQQHWWRVCLLFLLCPYMYVKGMFSIMLSRPVTLKKSSTSTTLDSSFGLVKTFSYCLFCISATSLGSVTTSTLSFIKGPTPLKCSRTS